MAECELQISNNEENPEIRPWEGAERGGCGVSSETTRSHRSYLHWPVTPALQERPLKFTPGFSELRAFSLSPEPTLAVPGPGGPPSESLNRGGFGDPS